MRVIKPKDETDPAGLSRQIIDAANQAGGVLIKNMGDAGIYKQNVVDLNPPSRSSLDPVCCGQVPDRPRPKAERGKQVFARAGLILPER
jgi:hypothetical protein